MGQAVVAAVAAAAAAAAATVAALVVVAVVAQGHPLTRQAAPYDARWPRTAISPTTALWC